MIISQALYCKFQKCTSVQSEVVVTDVGKVLFINGASFMDRR